MDLKDTEARHDCAGEDQQQFDRLNELVVHSPQSDQMYHADVQHILY
jgi:hypothetical protein